MTTERCRQWRERLGALVLGQLGDDERAATEAHLEGCAECRAERDLLRPMAEVLPLADPSWLDEAPAPPSSLGRRIARKVEAEQRVQRRRFRLRAGFGAAAVATAAALALVLTGGGSAGPEGTRVEFANLPQGVRIGAHLQPRPWGSQVSVYVHGMRRGTRCVVFLRDAGGDRVTAGSFRYSYHEGAGADLSAAMRLADARAIGIRAGHRTFVAPIPQSGTA
jgi:anti-sigma factor RsiW